MTHHQLVNSCLFLIITCMTSQAHAFFCPTNFNQIELGYTQKQIEDICGKPAKVTERKEPAEDNSPQEWSYFIKQNPSLGSLIPGNIKATIAFDQNGKVINMTINGLSVSETNFCGHTTVKIGTKRDDIKALCGTPAYINRGENPGAPPAVEKKFVDYQYDSTPPVTLVFQNEILVEKK